MDILHLSDLHLTEAGLTFTNIEAGLHNVLRGRKFDFIVVSGDLSQRAARPEYLDATAGLLRFAQQYLLGCLKVRAVERIIFVPGNHDIDYEIPVASLVDVNDVVTTRRLAGIQELDLQLSQGSIEGLRRHVGRHGGVEYYQIDQAKYLDRFRNVQEFFDKFYEGGMSDKHRKFQLTSAGGDWSAHVFPEEQVVFCGFSSCHENDKYSKAASVSSQAISAARDYIRSINAETFLMIAVWHHGVRASRHGTDYLVARDVGQLYMAGFTIGFHGHVHETLQTRLEDELRDRFLIFGAGSLGAGAKERAVDAGNQFSTISILSNFVYVDMFQRRASSGMWTQLGGTTILERATDDGSSKSIARCNSHERTYTVDIDDGIASVHVQYEGLRLTSNLLVGLLRQPYCAALPQSQSVGTSDSVVIERKTVKDQGIAFLAVPTRDGEYHNQLRWGYQASNVLPVNTAELALRGNYEPWEPKVQEGEFATRPHTVRLPCEVLTLKTQYRLKDAIVENFQGTAVPRVERLVSDHRGDRWQSDPTEEKRCDVTQQPGTVTLVVRRPIVGCRYSVVTKMADEGRPHPPMAKVLSKRLLHWCADERTKSVREGLTQIVEAQLTSPLGSNLSDVSDWVGFIWDFDRKCLVPLFGRYSSALANSTFSFGIGVAGHSFRFSSVATWIDAPEHQSTRTSLIFQETPTGVSNAPVYEWIVCVPLLLGGAGPSIGVLSFAFKKNRSSDSPAVQRLKNFAETYARNQIASEPSSNELVSNATVGFWTPLTKPQLGWLPHEKRYVDEVYASLVTPP